MGERISIFGDIIGIFFIFFTKILKFSMFGVIIFNDDVMKWSLFRKLKLHYLSTFNFVKKVCPKLTE